MESVRHETSNNLTGSLLSYVSLTHKNSSSRFVDSLGTSQLVEMSLVGYIIYYILYILLHIVMYPTKGILM